MFPVLTALKVAAGSIVDRANTLAQFVVVPDVPSRVLLDQFGIDPSALECHFCHSPLTDLRHLRAIYNYHGKYVASCDRFECAIKARDRLIE